MHYAKKHVSRKGVIFLQETHSVQKDEQVWTNLCSFHMENQTIGEF